MRKETGLNSLEMIIARCYICWVDFEGKKVSQLVDCWAVLIGSWLCIPFFYTYKKGSLKYMYFNDINDIFTRHDRNISFLWTKSDCSGKNLGHNLIIKKFGC